MMCRFLGECSPSDSPVRVGKGKGVLEGSKTGRVRIGDLGNRRIEILSGMRFPIERFRIARRRNDAWWRMRDRVC